MTDYQKKPNRNPSCGDNSLRDSREGVTNMVIGNKNSFTLALGKYAFIPCDKIPKAYLEWLIKTNLINKDRSIISDYLENNG